MGRVLVGPALWDRVRLQTERKLRSRHFVFYDQWDTLHTFGTGFDPR